MPADAEPGSAMVASAAALLTAAEAERMSDLCDTALQAASVPNAKWHAGLNELADLPQAGPAFGLLVSHARRWHDEVAASTRMSSRLVARRELVHLRELSRLRWLDCCAAGGAANACSHPPAVDLGPYIQQSYELVAGRAAGAAEVDAWMTAIGSKRASVGDMQQGLLQEAAARSHAQAAPPATDASAVTVMGTSRCLTRAEWQAQAAAGFGTAPVRSSNRSRFGIAQDGPRPRVTALLSLWRGGAHIGRFMDNITAQDGFDAHCELVIVDAASPDNEIDLIRPYMDRHSNITYLRCDVRIGIYEAWNRAIAAARGAYLTSTNVDDLRRHDSLLLQAGVLDNLGYVDIVYQDFFYTLDPTLPFEAVERFGHVSRLPLVTPHNLLNDNPPHNAPMWRRTLHDELGLFETGYVSGADHEFWLRCLAAGKTFYKLDDPHVVYFYNPDGLSSRVGSCQPEEARRSRVTHAARLIPRDCTVTDGDFIERLAVPIRSARHDGARRRFAWAREALCNASTRDKAR